MLTGLNAPSERDLEREEDALRARAAELPPEKRREYHARVDRESRDPDTYAALNWVLFAGLHHFYLGAWLRGAVNLALAALGTLLAFAGAFAGLLLIALVFLIELPALFRAQAVCRARNNRVARDILEELERG